MKKLFLIRDSLPNQISYYHLMLILVTLPFDMFYSHLLLASFCIHTLIHIDKDNLPDIFSWKNLALQSVFVLTLIGLVYSPMFQSGLTDLLRMAVILLFPALFSVNSLNFNKYRDRLLSVFAISCSGTIAWLYLHAFQVIRFYKLPYKAILSREFINHNFSAPIPIHATFFSLQIAVALVYLVSVLVKGNLRVWARVACVGGIVLLTAGLIQLGSKAVLIAVLLSVNVALPLLLLPRRKVLRYALISVTASAMLVGSALTINSFKFRYYAEMKNDLKQAVPDEAADPRLARWEAAFSVVKQKPLLGHGSGTELKVLGDQFYGQKLYRSYLANLNAHNQYLSFMLTAGSIGFLLYATTLALGFIASYIRHDFMLFSFVLLMAVVSLSESLLNAEKGVFFYGLFFSLFVYSIPPQRNRPSIKNFL